MKTLPRYSLNQLSKIFLGTVLSGLCLSLFAQDTPLATPAKTEYPGIVQTLEKLIQIDKDKFQKRLEVLVRAGRFSNGSNISGLDLDPDFLNSIVLHSPSGYLRLASMDKCRFYDTIITDLLRDTEGKIKNVLVTYIENESRQSAVISRKDFLTKVVNQECPETQKNIASFQIKTLSETLKSINFEIPTSMEQCRNVLNSWLNNSKTPYLCQIHEFIEEAKMGEGDPKDLEQRRSVARIIDGKMSLIQKDYVSNLCKNLDSEAQFCDEFLNVSFWTKIAGGMESTIYAEDICAGVLGVTQPTSSQYSICFARMKQEKDVCLYPGGYNTGLRPQPDCDLLSTALNHSSLKADYKDCPGNSDQWIVTNMGRILSSFGLGQNNLTDGPCQSVSAATVFSWNKKMDNDEAWKLEACFEDKIVQRDICTKTIFSNDPSVPESYTNVVADILKKTRGADNSQTCQMVDSETYNPILLNYKSGCWIVYERNNCFISQCKHKIVYNGRPVDVIKIKDGAALAYFPTSLSEERFSQNYVLTHEFKKKPKQLSTLNAVTAYFKKSPQGIIHGVSCGEDLLPTFFKAESLNQCTPIPFIINGMIKDGDKIVFVIRTSADSLQAPRLISWSIVYSGVRSYQKYHPMKLWTMYGLD